MRRFREDSGNAGMTARELPGAEVLASWQHVEQRALDLRAAGLPGTLQELRVRAYLDLLQERDSRDVADDQAVAADGPADEAAQAQDPGSSGGPGGSRSPAPQPGPAGPPTSTGAGHRTPADPSPSVAALVNLTVPLATVLGTSAAPGEAAGFGLLDAADARTLIAAAARSPATRWCLTVLHPDGTAVAHGCAVGQGHALPRGQPPAFFLTRLKFVLRPVIRGPCDHAGAEPGYRPGRQLQHLVKARNTRCTAPGCSRLAARCDLDHTQPWHQGGITCECNLAPLCRHHHKCKQSEGWKLEHPEPGTLAWTTPAGRHYITQPAIYAA